MNGGIDKITAHLDKIEGNIFKMDAARTKCQILSMKRALRGQK